MATELEIMRHARNYLDQLANGRNPLTGELLPEEDIVNNVRISRCLFYTSDVLRQVIARGGLHKPPKATKLFSLTAEQLEQFQYFEKPIYISAFTERLNSLIVDPDMRKISHRYITSFLESQGYLRQYTDSDGKLKRAPTDSGITLGISTEERYGSRGRYDVVLYDLNAQQYILEHLQEIIEARSNPSTSLDPGQCEPAEIIDQETGEIMKQNHV